MRSQKHKYTTPVQESRLATRAQRARWTVGWLTLLCLWPALAAGEVGELAWASTLGGAGICKGYDVASDDAGNVYITGGFYDSADFDPGDGVAQRDSEGLEDIFVVKLDRNGELVWVRTFGGEYADSGRGITADDDGNVLIAGEFRGTVDFDPGPDTVEVSAALPTATDIFVLKLDSDGGLIWVRAVGGEGYNRANAIAVDSEGNVVTTGEFRGTVDFDPGDGVHELVTGDRDHVFVLKLDANGDFVWAHAMGNNEQPTEAAGIAVDDSGSVYTTGHFRRTVDFDPGEGTFLLTSEDWPAVFLQKLEADGTFAWAGKLMADERPIWPADLAVDSEGSVLATGLFTGTVDFDPGDDVFVLDSGRREENFFVFLDDSFYVVKLDTDGNFVWARAMGARIGGDGRDSRGYGIDVDADGNVYTTGEFQGTVDFDPGSDTAALTYGCEDACSSDIFVQILDANGEFVWAGAMGGPEGPNHVMSWGDDGGTGQVRRARWSIAVDNAGSFHATGAFYGAVDFDPGPGTEERTAFGQSSDAFVTKHAAAFEPAAGGVQVDIEPAGAVSDGAQWRLNDDVWRDPGETVTGLASGEYTVAFSQIPGWLTPPPQQATITAGDTAQITATYLDFGIARLDRPVGLSLGGGLLTLEVVGLSDSTVVFIGDVEAPRINGNKETPGSLTVQIPSQPPGEYEVRVEDTGSNAQHVFPATFRYTSNPFETGGGEGFQPIAGAPEGVSLAAGFMPMEQGALQPLTYETPEGVVIEIPVEALPASATNAYVLIRSAERLDHLFGEPVTFPEGQTPRSPYVDAHILVELDGDSQDRELQATANAPITLYFPHNVAPQARSALTVGRMLTNIDEGFLPLLPNPAAIQMDAAPLVAFDAANRAVVEVEHLTAYGLLGPKLLGDVNGDGAVNAIDIQTVINAVLGLSIAPLDYSNADVNGDERVDALDIQIVINVVLGIEVIIDDGADGNGAPGNGGDDNGSGDGGDAEQRMAAMDEAGDHFATLDIQELGIEGKAQQMVAWLNAHDAFADAGASNDNLVWALFEDGFPVVFIDNYPVGDGELPEHTTSPETAVAAAHGAGPEFFRGPASSKIDWDVTEVFTNELPKSSKSEVLVALEDGFAAHTVAKELTERLAVAGYEPGPLTHTDPPSIQQITEMENIGVLLLVGHSSEIELERDIPGDFFDLGEGFIVQTPARIDLAEELGDVLPEIRAGRVIPVFSTVYVDDTRTPVKDWRWAITTKFIEHYVDFAEDAVVAVFGCNSYNEGFMQACFEKGAGAYFGFDQYIFDDWASPTFRHLISRALGSVVTAAWDSSPVRPFDFRPILQEMDRRGILTDDTSIDDLPDSLDLPPDWEGGATLRMGKPEGSRVSILAPSIRVVRVKAAQDVLEVHGLFGDKPETIGPDTHVTVGGTSLPILSWERWEIRCALPSSGAGAVGGVQVTINGIQSNVVTVSEFEGAANFTMATNDHGPFATAEADFRFRMPMQPFRMMPDSEPIFMLDDDLLETDLEELQRLFLRYMEMPGPVIGVWEADSTLSYAYEGQYQESGCGSPGFVSGEGLLNAHVFDWWDPTSLPVADPFVMGICMFFPDPDTGEMLMTVRPTTNLALGHHNSACSGMQEVQLIDGRFGPAAIEGPMSGYDLLEGSRTDTWTDNGGGYSIVTWDDLFAKPAPPVK